jgi:PAS domain S-box-containing protein
MSQLSSQFVPFASEDLVRAMAQLFDLVDSYAYVKDTAGRYVFTNKKVQELFGRTAEEIVGKDDSAFFDLALADQLRVNDRLVIDGGQTIDREEKNVVKATGEERVYWTVKTPIRDRAGRIIGMCGISTDVTGRKRG